jgi:hypothetical protein
VASSLLEVFYAFSCSLNEVKSICGSSGARRCAANLHWKKNGPHREESMPKKPAPKANAKVKVIPHAVTAAIDWPDDRWEKFGCKHYEMLLEKRKKNRKLVGLEEHLVLKHFPSQRKRVEKQQQEKEAEKKKRQSEDQAKSARKAQREAEQAQFSPKV